MVKVRSPKDNLLFRAKILKNNNGSYDVFYIDFGNIETVPSNVIYELADKLKTVFFLIILIYYLIFNDHVFYCFYPYYDNLIPEIYLVLF